MCIRCPGSHIYHDFSREIVRERGSERNKDRPSKKQREIECHANRQTQRKHADKRDKYIQTSCEIETKNKKKSPLTLSGMGGF